MSDSLVLAQLNDGQSAYVTVIENEPSMRRRLADLGLIRGTKVTCLCRSPAGDPAAYMIRGAVIALRRRDASQVQVSPVCPPPVTPA